MEELGSAGAGEQLPSASNLADTVVPSSAEAAPSGSSSAAYLAAPTVHDDSAAKVAEDDWTREEAQGIVTTKEDVPEQPAEEAMHHQPGVFAQTALHCMPPALFSATINHNTWW